MKKKSLITSLLIAVAILLSCTAISFARDMSAKQLVAEAGKNLPVVTANQAKAKVGKKGIIFLDVREPKEFKRGHVPGAVNIPRGLLEFKIGKKISSKKSNIIIYCKSGGRSTLAGHAIGRMGYNKVKNLTGGWKAWTKAGGPVD